MFNHLFDIEKKISIQRICFNSEKLKNISFDIARFDKLHPVISGNKFFKLKYNIQKAIKNQNAGIITMGGAFSNHLSATAHACNICGLPSIGIIRGEIPEAMNPTLSDCINQKMQLIAVPRNQFNEKSEAIQQILHKHQNLHFIPMGGANEEGIKGAAEMPDMIHEFDKYDLIVCAIGSGTMFKGISKRLNSHQRMLGIPTMKIQEKDKQEYINAFKSNHKIEILTDFARKGYGKADDELIHFMNYMFKEYQLPLDFVYTGKLVYAVISLLEKEIIEENKSILVIHSGGLQGNRSLPSAYLIF